MCRKKILPLLLSLFFMTILDAQEVRVQGVCGYSGTYKWYGGLDVQGAMQINNTDFNLNLEALTENVYSMGMTVSPAFNVCTNGYLFLDGTLHSRIFANYKTYEFVYAASAGFRMRHFLVQAGLFSRTIDAFGRDWHSLQNYVTEPFNLLYKVRLNLKGNDHPWDVYAVFSNFNEYEYERMWEPIFSLGGRWDFKDRWSAIAEGTLEPAGIFHGTVKFYEAIMRVGVSFRLERSGMEKSSKK